jgi:hypothetical protein
LIIKNERIGLTKVCSTASRYQQTIADSRFDMILLIIL